MIAVYVVVGIVVILLIVLIVVYNRLVNMHNQMKNLWAQVDVQLKRRYDLIPNLVETVKGYAAHERGTLEAVTDARNIAQSASGAGVADRAKAEGELGSALARLLIVAENYPNLKANENFLALQQQLSTAENNISAARQKYNDMVMMCNNLNQQFPSNMVARVFGFHDGEFFEVKTVEERAAPRVGFS
jgi:LemA protein